MLSFTGTLLLSIICFFVGAVWIIVVCIKTKKDGGKIGEKIASTCLVALSFISILYMSIPIPTIYPLENEAKVYDGKLKITIDSNDSNPLIHTYYSLDGSDPRNGNIYEGEFTITKSTTVFARNKFLGRWSEPYKSTYRFESIPITISNSENPYIDDKFISLNEVSDLIKIIIGFGVVIYLFKITIIDGFKNLFR